MWQRNHQMFSYLSDGLTGLCCSGSWIPWRVLYRNPSKSLNESAPLYCSPGRKNMSSQFLIRCLTLTCKTFHGPIESLSQLFHNHRLICLRCPNLKSFQFQKFLNRIALAFSKLCQMGLTWKMRRSIWYFRTCTGAPSVTV